MTYIELINRFWDSTRSNPSSCNEIAMYLYLLHQCNIQRWINPFKFKTRNLELALGISRATITAIRDKLKQRGVIDFVKGGGSGSSIYLICGVKVTDKALAEKICVQPKNTMLNTNLNTNADSEKICVQPKNTMLNTNLNTNANSTLYIEDNIRHKDNTTSRDVVAPPPPPVSENLFAEEEKKASKRKPKSTKASPPAPPTLEEVLQYFLQENADTRLQNWERSAMLFYDTYNADGWLNKYGRRITNWESEANKWMFYREEKEKKHNETNQTDRLSERRGAEPKYDGSENFDGPF